MQSAPEVNAWDFSPVYNLLSSLQSSSPPGRSFERAQGPGSGDPVNDKTRTTSQAPTNNSNTHRSKEDVTLGDFARLWDYLGIQPDKPTPTVATFESNTSTTKDALDAYASDGALYYPPSSKTVTWKDETDGGDLAETQEDSPPPSGLNKNQRKKRNRKARQEASDAEILEMVQALRRSRKAVAEPMSGDESQDASTPVRRANAPKHDVHGVRKPPYTPDNGHRYDLRSKSTSAKGHARVSSLDESDDHASPSLRKSRVGSGLRPAQVAPVTSALKAASKSNTPTKPPSKPTASYQSDSNLPTRNNGITKKTIHESDVKPQKEWPVADPFAEKLRLASNGPVATQQPSHLHKSNKTPPAVQHSLQTLTPTRTRHEIVPVAHKNSDDRNWSLLMKLLHNFPEDKSKLLSPLQLSINRPVTTGIHVFVDASNILIGFHQHLKRARGIPEEARTPRVFPSFHALALLLERRRPAAKRVLVGSTPEVAAFEEARQVGYETCILDKVWKARELTERQRRYAARATGSGNGYHSGSDSATDSAAPAAHAQQAPKWVEQAVDEIIHLKMLESLVDTPVPDPASVPAGGASQAPVMVLATGDAAEAEYSSGFMKMVERALNKGWRVEVVAWGASVSFAYRHMEAKKKYAGRFRIIELDQYAEELFPPEA